MNAFKTVALPMLFFVLKTATIGDLFAQTHPPPGFVVIVHSSNSLTKIDRQILEYVFLKKITRWPNKDNIRPVDLPIDSAVREKFTKEILQRSIVAIASYWQQAIFSGRDVPPVELKTDNDVMKYVAEHPGAIGYIANANNLNGIKVLTLE